MAKYPEWLYEKEDSNIDAIRANEAQRIETGVGFNDWINFDHYLAYVIAAGMQRFIDDSTGHPGSMTYEEWIEAVTTIRDGFTAYRSWELEYFSQKDSFPDGYKEARAKMESKFHPAMKLFGELFENFWD